MQNVLIAAVTQLPHTLTRRINSFTKTIVKKNFGFVVQKTMHKFSNFKFEQWSTFPKSVNDSEKVLKFI